MAISNGQLNAVAAFMSGKLKSQGDMSHLMKLQSVFKLG
jgi:putative sterol carrier protein